MTAALRKASERQAETAEAVFELADTLSCEILRNSYDNPQLSPFLIVMEESAFRDMMMSDSAPRYVHFDHKGEFAYPSSGWRICGLPIRRVPDGDWKGKVVEPYPLVMTQLQAQMSFGGDYG